MQSCTEAPLPTRTLPNSLGYYLRAANPTDLAPVEALLTAAGLTLNDVGSQFGPQYRVALSGSGELIGVAGVEVCGPYGLFRSAAVRADWRGRRVGEALTADRIAWARTAGLEVLFLLTQTAADYWPRFGFVVIDRTGAPEALSASSEWAGACPASATAMRLDLCGPSASVVS
jgi:amino-acid N-acetyltransferase